METQKPVWDKCMSCGNKNIKTEQDRDKCGRCGWEYEWRSPGEEKELIEQKIRDLLNYSIDTLPQKQYNELFENIKKQINTKQ